MHPLNSEKGNDMPTCLLKCIVHCFSLLKGRKTGKMAEISVILLFVSAYWRGVLVFEFDWQVSSGTKHWQGKRDKVNNTAL